MLLFIMFLIHHERNLHDFIHSFVSEESNIQSRILITRQAFIWKLSHSSRVSFMRVIRMGLCNLRNLSEILSNQTEIRLYLPFSDRFGSKRNSVWC